MQYSSVEQERCFHGKKPVLILFVFLPVILWFPCEEPSSSDDAVYSVERKYLFYCRGRELGSNVFWEGGRYSGGEVLAREKAEVPYPSFLNLRVRERKRGGWVKRSDFHVLDFLLVGTEPSVRVRESGPAAGAETERSL